MSGAKLIVFDVHVMGLLQLPGPLHVASEIIPLDDLLAHDGRTVQMIRPIAWDMTANYRTDVALEEDTIAGWRSATATLRVWNYHFEAKPLQWYEEEPTDWHTGMARYLQTQQPTDHTFTKYVTGPTWVLTARRAR